MARVRRQYRHAFIKEKQPVNEQRMLPGMIVNFLYTAEDAYDRNPDVFIFHVDGKYVHGINIDYIPSNQVANLFRIVAKHAGVLLENKVQTKNPYPRAQLSHPQYSPGANTGKYYYDLIKINSKLKEVYRTYKKSNISAPRVCNIDYESFGLEVIVED